jgi:hypothetical protein
MSYLGAPTMTAKNVADTVLHIFGDQAQVQLDDPKIITFINMGQREIILSNDINKKSGTTSAVANQDTYDISSLKALSITSVRYNGRPIPFKSFQEAEEYIISQDPQNVVRSEPVLWYTWENLLKVYPTPSISVPNAISIYYVKDFTPVVNTTDLLSVPDRYFNALVQYVLAQAYELDEDAQNSQFKLGQFDSSIRNLSTKDQSSENSEKYYPFITVLPEDDGY